MTCAVIDLDRLRDIQDDGDQANAPAEGGSGGVGANQEERPAHT